MPVNFKTIWARLAGYSRSLSFKTLARFINSRYYIWFGLLILGSTSVLWSLLGAKINSANSDQLVYPYLFDSTHAFHMSYLPLAHNFLIKWPLFWLIRVFGYSPVAYDAVTVGAVLATLLIFVIIIYKIERRPQVFGTLCLAIASVLLLIPTQPTAGGLLPVNMAMLSTRNLEYALFILIVLVVAKTVRLKSRWFAISVILLAILTASDRLFLPLALGGALLALTVYALSRGWNLVSLSVNWLIAAVTGAGLGLVLLWIINSRLVHLVSSSVAGPYGLVNSAHDALLGLIYGLLGLLTNFGANPVFDTTVVRRLPHDAIAGLFSLGGLAYLINLVIFAIGVWACWRLVKTSLAHNKKRSVELDNLAKFSILLIWVSLASLLFFIFTNHHYAVDARYLAISFFTLFSALAVHARRVPLPSGKLVVIGFALIVSVTLGIFTAVRTYHTDQTALQAYSSRDQLVAQAIHQHPVKVLVGDYWRVIPTKSLSAGSKLKIMPLGGCTQPQQIFTSQSWQIDLTKNSFAYLLSLDRSMTNYPSCNLNEIIAKYGRPNSSLLIAGTFKSPKELLLFYDRGIHRSAPVVQLRTPSTVLPIPLDELPHTTCAVPTILNVVAHQDDDLLFMNPDLLHDIQAGHCIRTVYVTGGDAGAGQFYWLSRQQGSQAAYSKMLGLDDVWIDRIVRLTDKEFITISNPKGNSQISLIFMHLPDGGVKGQGFAATHFESLARLQAGNISQMNSIDAQSVYTSADLVTALDDLMHAYGPSEIRTQANFVSSRYPDHSDHMAVGRFVKLAYQRYETEQYENRLTIPISFYIGYPVHQMPDNVSGGDLDAKKAAFYEYGQHDAGVCDSDQQCSHNQAYSAYLTHEYTYSE